MSSKRSRFIFSVITMSFALLSATMWGQTAQAPGATAGVAPAAKAQAPSAQADVAYANGQLTIKGNGAPLIDVLRAACKKIGAELDAQAQPTDPVSGTLGPGPAKDVLDTLLSDAHVNYVLGATAAEPNAITSIMISPQAQDSSPRSQVAQDQVEEAKDSLATAAPVRSATSQMMELLEAAKSELGNAADFQGADYGDGSQTKQVDMATVLQQIEAQLKAAQSGTAISQNQDPATDTNGPDSHTANPNGRPMHRKHH